MRLPCPHIFIFALIIGFQPVSRLQAQLISVTSELNADSMMIGDQLLFTLRVEADTHVDFSLPAITDTLSRNLEVLYPVSADTILADRTRRVEHKYLITSFQEGMQVLPAQRVVYSYRGKKDTALSMPLVVSVYEPAVDTTQAIKPIKPPIKTPLTFREILPWIGLGMGALLLVAAAVVAYRYLRRRRGDPEIFSLKPRDPPHVIAFRELDRLKEEKLWERGHVKAFYTRLTEITRTYIERQYGIPAMERTTGEIMQAFRRSNTENGLLEEMLGDLLNVADLVKFAKEEPLPVDNQTNLNNAYLFVQKTYPLFYMEKPKPEETSGLDSETSSGANIPPGETSSGANIPPVKSAEYGKEGLRDG